MPRKDLTYGFKEIDDSEIKDALTTSRGFYDEENYLIFRRRRARTGSQKEEMDPFRLWLSERLQALHYPGQLCHLPDAHMPSKTALPRWKEFGKSCIARIRLAFNFRHSRMR